MYAPSVQGDSMLPGRSDGKIRIVIYGDIHDRDCSVHLAKHLAVLKHDDDTEVWHPGEIGAGDSVEHIRDEKIRDAAIILVLISAEHIQHWDKPISEAVRNAHYTKQRIIPVVARYCAWEAFRPLSDRKPLPPDGLPLMESGQMQEARFKSVVKEVLKIRDELRAERDAWTQNTAHHGSKYSPPMPAHSPIHAASQGYQQRVPAKGNNPIRAALIWAAVLLAFMLISAITLFLWVKADSVCCGGKGCSREDERSEGTSCAQPGHCNPCKSGRYRVEGACATPLPSGNTYNLRLAGATLPGYIPGKTDQICVQLPGQAPRCGEVEATMNGPVLGQASVADLSTHPGLDIWFTRGGTSMRSLRGMRLERTKEYYTLSALCTGAVLYSADHNEIIRFFLDDL